eukprot:jgi/Ulvmu1/7261/UM035_0048.1
MDSPPPQCSEQIMMVSVARQKLGSGAGHEPCLRNTQTTRGAVANWWQNKSFHMQCFRCVTARSTVQRGHGTHSAWLARTTLHGSALRVVHWHGRLQKLFAMRWSCQRVRPAHLAAVNWLRCTEKLVLTQLLVRQVNIGTLGLTQAPNSEWAWHVGTRRAYWQCICTITFIAIWRFPNIDSALHEPNFIAAFPNNGV